MTERRNQAFEKAISSTVKLYEILQGIETRDFNGNWLQFLYWNTPMDENQKQARLLMNGIVQIISKQNDQVSYRLIYQRIVHDLIQKAIWFSKDYPDFPLAAKKEMQILFQYDSYRDIDIPLVYLVTENSPVKFGPINIHSITEDDLNHEWWKKILASGGDNLSVRAYARVVSCGDLDKSRENAVSIVDDMLIFLRAIGFPITTKSQNQFGLLNEHSTLLIPYRIGLPIENYKLEFPVRLSTKVSMLHTYEIRRDIFSQISPTTLTRISKLIDEDYPKPSTDLKRKFLLGLHWLGEATKPDTVSARFVKLSFSLEGLIGGETGDSRDTKIILAKRCAIIADNNVTEQKKLYNAILRYYKIRSEIVHGVDKKITENDFSSFGECVRRLAWALLERIDDFQNINELHNWTLTHPSWSLLQ